MIKLGLSFKCAILFAVTVYSNERTLFLSEEEHPTNDYVNLTLDSEEKSQELIFNPCLYKGNLLLFKDQKDMGTYYSVDTILHAQNKPVLSSTIGMITGSVFGLGFYTYRVLQGADLLETLILGPAIYPNLGLLIGGFIGKSLGNNKFLIQNKNLTEELNICSDFIDIQKYRTPQENTLLEEEYRKSIKGLHQFSLNIGILDFNGFTYKYLHTPTYSNGYYSFYVMGQYNVFRETYKPSHWGIYVGLSPLPLKFFDNRRKGRFRISSSIGLGILNIVEEDTFVSMDISVQLAYHTLYGIGYFIEIQGLLPALRFGLEF